MLEDAVIASQLAFPSGVIKVPFEDNSVTNNTRRKKVKQQSETGRATSCRFPTLPVTNSQKGKGYRIGMHSNWNKNEPLSYFYFLYSMLLHGHLGLEGRGHTK